MENIGERIDPDPPYHMIIHALQTVLNLNKKYAFLNCVMYKYRVRVFRLGYCIHYTGEKVG